MPIAPLKCLCSLNSAGMLYGAEKAGFCLGPSALNNVFLVENMESSFAIVPLVSSILEVAYMPGGLLGKEAELNIALAGIYNCSSDLIALASFWHDKRWIRCSFEFRI